MGKASNRAIVKTDGDGWYYVVGENNSLYSFTYAGPWRDFQDALQCADDINQRAEERDANLYSLTSNKVRDAGEKSS